MRAQRTLALLSLAPLLLAQQACEDLPNVQPLASFVYTPVSPIYAGQTAVTFTAIASQDPDGTIRSYLWNFGDGTAEQRSDGPTVVHTFPDTAARCIDITYAVLLSVTDDQGALGHTSQNVRITELPLPDSAACRPPVTATDR